MDFQVPMLFWWFSVTSPAWHREVNSLVKLVINEDLQIEPLSKSKKNHDLKVEFGRSIVGSQSQGNHTKHNRNSMISMFAFCHFFE